MVGKAKVVLSKPILDKIRAWATPPFNQKLSIDKLLVELLLVKLVGMANLVTHDVSDSVKEFIYGNQGMNFSIRHRFVQFILFFHRIFAFTCWH